MKKILSKMTIAVLLPISLLACGNDDEPELAQEDSNKATPSEQKTDNPDEDVPLWLPATRPIAMTDAEKEFVVRSNDFSFNFYRALSTRERGSNITSPLSVGYLLGMMNDGAQGQTSDEICSVLGYKAGDKASFDSFCRKLMEEAPQVDPSVTLRIANTVVANKQVKLEDTFRQQAEQYYFAGVNSLDFSQPSALEWINGWCNEQTGGMIPKMMDMIEPDAQLVLMNAIYFNANWTEKFDAENTKEETFQSGKKETLVPMMYRRAATWFAQNDIYSVLDLPYGGGENFMSWNIYFLLPNEGRTVDDVVSSLSQTTWKETLESFKMTYVDIYLPRFATQSDITLNGVITGMGAPTMFSEETADFSPMTKNFKKADGKLLWVDLMKQKAAMKVTEEGTELTSTSVNTWVHGGGWPLADFHANRPFVYVIQEASSGAIFFIGTFMGE